MRAGCPAFSSRRPGGPSRSPADGGARGTPATDSAPAALPPGSEPPELRARAPLTARASPRTGRGAAAASGPWCGGARGAGPASGRPGEAPRRAGLASAVSLSSPRALRCRGLRRGPGSGPPGRTGAGWGGRPRPRRPALCARCSERSRDPTPRRAAPARPRSAWRSPARSSPPRAASPPRLQPRAGAGAGAGAGRWSRRGVRPPRSEVGAARRPCLQRRLRCGPGGEEFPQLHA